MAAPAPLPPAPPMPPPMHIIMRNKGRNYDCYRKQNGDGTFTYGFLIRKYQSPEGEKAIFVYHKDGANKADHVKMAKLALVDREQCAHIPNQDKLMLYNEGGSRNNRRRYTRRSFKKRTTRRRK
jgi:hypothetical protein